MEGFIVVIVLGLISMFFKNIGSNEEKKSMPSFGGKTIQPNTLKKVNKEDKGFSLEEFAREIYQKIDDQLQEKPIFTAKSNIEKPLVEQNERTVTTSNNFNRNSNIVNEQKVEMTRQNDKKQNEIPNYIPNSKEALVNAIITSEIFGPPIAKRR